MSGRHSGESQVSKERPGAPNHLGWSELGRSPVSLRRFRTVGDVVVDGTFHRVTIRQQNSQSNRKRDLGFYTSVRIVREAGGRYQPVAGVSGFRDFPDLLVTKENRISSHWTLPELPNFNLTTRREERNASSVRHAP